MKDQEVFDKVAEHLLTQHRKSIRNGNPAYYGLNGMRCAIGVLIPENEYREEFENKAVARIKASVPALRDLNVALLDDLQDVHDGFKPSIWATQLRRVALRHDLSVAKLRGKK